jgi:hypothetical protein
VTRSRPFDGIAKNSRTASLTAHPARADPRPEPQVALGDRPAFKPAGVDEAPQTGVGNGPQSLEPLLDEDPVLSFEFGHVGHRPDGDELHVMGQAGGLAGLFEQGLDELEGDADARQVPVRIAGVLEDGVEDGDGLGQLFAGQVVVGDDDLHPAGPGLGDELHGLDAAVDADDEFRAPFDGHVDVMGLDAVALRQPLGNEIIHLGPQRLEGLIEHDHGQDAVDVVIAEDQDLLPVPDGPLDALDSRGHPFHEVGVMETFQAPEKEPPGRRDVEEAAVGQNCGQRERQVEGRGQLGRLGPPGFHDPQRVVHTGFNVTIAPDGQRLPCQSRSCKTGAGTPSLTFKRLKNIIFLPCFEASAKSSAGPAKRSSGWARFSAAAGRARKSSTSWRRS